MQCKKTIGKFCTFNHLFFCSLNKHELSTYPDIYTLPSRYSYGIMGQSMVPSVGMTADIQDCGKGWLRRQRGLVYMIPLLRLDEDSESILKDGRKWSWSDGLEFRHLTTTDSNPQIKDFLLYVIRAPWEGYVTWQNLYFRKIMYIKGIETMCSIDKALL